MVDFWVKGDDRKKDMLYNYLEVVFCIIRFMDRYGKGLYK